MRRPQTLQTVVMGPDEWTPQNGLVTAAQKLNRKAILEKFHDELEVRFILPAARCGWCSRFVADQPCLTSRTVGLPLIGYRVLQFGGARLCKYHLGLDLLAAECGDPPMLCLCANVRSDLRLPLDQLALARLPCWRSLPAECGQARGTASHTAAGNLP